MGSGVGRCSQTERATRLRRTHSHLDRAALDSLYQCTHQTAPIHSMLDVRQSAMSTHLRCDAAHLPSHRASQDKRNACVTQCKRLSQDAACQADCNARRLPNIPSPCPILLAASLQQPAAASHHALRAATAASLQTDAHQHTTLPPHGTRGDEDGGGGGTDAMLPALPPNRLPDPVAPALTSLPPTSRAPVLSDMQHTAGCAARHARLAPS